MLAGRDKVIICICTVCREITPYLHASVSQTSGMIYRRRGDKAPLYKDVILFRRHPQNTAALAIYKIAIGVLHPALNSVISLNNQSAPGDSDFSRCLNQVSLYCQLVTIQIQNIIKQYQISFPYLIFFQGPAKLSLKSSIGQPAAVTYQLSSGEYSF